MTQPSYRCLEKKVSLVINQRITYLDFFFPYDIFRKLRLDQINAALFCRSKFHADVMFRDKRMMQKRQEIMKLLFVIASEQTVVFNIVSNKSSVIMNEWSK